MNVRPPSECIFKAQLIVARSWDPGHRIDQAYLKGQLNKGKMPQAEKNGLEGKKTKHLASLSSDQSWILIVQGWKNSKTTKVYFYLLFLLFQFLLIAQCQKINSDAHLMWF